VPPCGQKQQRGPDAAITGTQQAARLIGQAMDAGINLFDTASYMDGAAESMLASALGKRRAEVLISSRLGSRPSTTHRHPGLSRSDITWSLEQSLQRLGSDWIDLCVVPHEDPHTPLEETLQTLDEMVRAGKVRFLGFANWPAWKAARALELQKANGWTPSALVRCTIHSAGAVWSANPAHAAKLWPGADREKPTGRQALPQRQPGAGQRLPEQPRLAEGQRTSYRLAEQLREMAARHQASTAQIALAWMLSRDAVSSIVPVQQQDCLHAATLQLSPAELILLDTASAPMPLFPDWFVDEADNQTPLAAMERSCA
jgi:aryl-alcohol dehydrogenase-like predicted oxidoreductase